MDAMMKMTKIEIEPLKQAGSQGLEFHIKNFKIAN